MVSAALKPHYNRKEIDKERYTDINRDVSRMLYDKVWDGGGLIDQRSREQWQIVACEEVAEAIKNSSVTEKGVAEDTTSEATSSQIAMRPAVVQA